MVLQLEFCARTWLENLSFKLSRCILIGLVWVVPGSFCIESAQAENSHQGRQYLKDASDLYHKKSYFKAARYAFAASHEDPSLLADSYAWITLGLMHSGLPNAASYFFIRTLQAGNRAAIRSVLTQTQDLISVVGADLLRKYLIRHTSYSDYDENNKSAFLYSLAKDTLLSGDESRALGYLNGIDSSSPLWPYSLQLKGTANAILGKNFEAIQDFRGCASDSSRILNRGNLKFLHVQSAEREVEDLKARCIAGEARVLYQMENYKGADRTYDSIQKSSFVWPDILFEQAWNSFGKNEYNRSLGKLVSYKSPTLEFVFNSEVEVLRAQSFLALCLYADANEEIKRFHAKYTPVGEEIKDYVERHSDNLPEFFNLGRKVLKTPLYNSNSFYHVVNRFVRAPTFQNLVLNENQVRKERELIAGFDRLQSGVSHQLGAGFPGFLGEVLGWRTKTIHLLGGAFVKNSLMDFHSALLEDYEKMSFIKLEMLKDAKDKLLGVKTSSQGRVRGNQEPSRRDDQYRWSFNGEFWIDELGDYVFGLESECKG